MVTRKSSDINNSHGHDEDPPSKRWKRVPFDCKVILGKERYEYDCYEFVLTFQSGFFEDFLQMPLPDEETMRVVEFEFGVTLVASIVFLSATGSLAMLMSNDDESISPESQ